MNPFSRTLKMSERELACQSLIQIKSAITDTNEYGAPDSDDQEDLITFGPEFEEPWRKLNQ